MMPRYFTLAQAEKLLPEVASAIRETVAFKADYERMQGEWENFAQRITLAGGMQVDRVQVLEQKSAREETARRLKQAIEKVHELGCIVKDLDIGLIDFPALFEGREVYLCWKLGEDSIQFWHGVDEGFRGRKPIDAGFLEQQRGERPN